MRHVGPIARRELGSLFASPVAYVVLTLWSVLAGFFFLAQVMQFENEIARMQQYGAFDLLRAFNLNDHLLTPFFGSMWIVLIFAIPGLSMGMSGDFQVAIEEGATVVRVGTRLYSGLLPEG